MRSRPRAAFEDIPGAVGVGHVAARCSSGCCENLRPGEGRIKTKSRRNEGTKIRKERSSITLRILQVGESSRGSGGSTSGENNHRGWAAVDRDAWTAEVLHPGELFWMCFRKWWWWDWHFDVSLTGGGVYVLHR